MPAELGQWGKERSMKRKERGGSLGELWMRAFISLLNILHEPLISPSSWSDLWWSPVLTDWLSCLHPPGYFCSRKCWSHSRGPGQTLRRGVKWDVRRNGKCHWGNNLPSPRNTQHSFMLHSQQQQQAWLYVRLCRQEAEPCTAAIASLTAGPSFLGEETEIILATQLKTFHSVLIYPFQGIFHCNFSTVGSHVLCLCAVLILSPNAYPEGRGGGGGE